MYELRILNGLHRGATLPLDGRPHVIGASEDADVVLVDPGIATQHATLELTELGWSLSAVDGDVLGAENNKLHSVLDLMPGDFARLGHVWLTVVDEGTEWQDPPPEPSDIPVDELTEAGTDAYVDDADGADGAGGADSSIDTGTAHHDEMGGRSNNDESDFYSDSMLDEADHAPAPVHAEAAASRPDLENRTVAAPPRRRSRWSKSRMIMVPLTMVTILSACAAYSITSKSEDDTTFKKPDVRALATLGAQPPSGKGDNAPAAGAIDAPAKPARLVGHALREAFRQRLKDVDLLKRFDLKLHDDAWTMNAALDDEEAARFERVLAGFVRQHGITFPIHAKVGSAEAMLPFQIRQVTSGANASVVTHDGNRLYIGDEYRGVRLVAINGNHLKFTGKRNIEVKW